MGSGDFTEQEGVDVPQHYLNPLGNAEDFTLLKYLVNRNEQTFLGVLQENYPGHNDHNPNTMLVRRARARVMLIVGEVAFMAPLL